MTTRQFQHDLTHSLRFDLEPRPGGDAKAGVREARCQRWPRCEDAADLLTPDVAWRYGADEDTLQKTGDVFLIPGRAFVTFVAGGHDGEIGRVGFVQQDTGGHVIAGARLSRAVSTEGDLTIIAKVA